MYFNSESIQFLCTSRNNNISPILLSKQNILHYPQLPNKLNSTSTYSSNSISIFLLQLYCNNQSSIKFVHNPIYHHKIKHIDIVYYYTRSCLINNIFQLAYISTKDNTTDIIMKGLINDLYS